MINRAEGAQEAAPAASRCWTALLESENEVVLGDEASFGTEGPGFRSPNLESVLFIESKCCLRSLAHTEVDLTDLDHSADMANRRRK